MSIASEISRLQGAKSDLKTSIEGKGVTVPAATKIDGYAALVDQIPQGGGTTEAEENDVIFIDYDGTRLYSYSAADFLALAAMPANPTHSGLTAQGWNWTLADAQSYVTDYGGLVIGQNYITSDGKTRAYFRLTAPRLTLPMYVYETVSGGVTVDWGDGSTETLSGTAIQQITHTYAAEGDYLVSFTVSSGTFTLGPWYSFIPTQSNYNFCYPDALKKVELGSGIVELGMYAPTQSWVGLSGLETITIPTSVTTMSYTGAFYGTPIKAIVFPSGMTAIANNFISYCHWLKYVSLPKSVTSIGYNIVYCYNLRALYLTGVYNGSYEPTSCPRLKRFALVSGTTAINTGSWSGCGLQSATIPDTVTTIAANAFYQCRLLLTVTIGSGITSIGSGAFGNCTSLAELHIKATTPPTLGGAITNLPSDCVIYVPSGTISAYQSATNWSTYSSQMQEE